MKTEFFIPLIFWQEKFGTEVDFGHRSDCGYCNRCYCSGVWYPLEVRMFQDIRHAVRVLYQAKGWAAVVLLSLALGIGANTALFSGVNGLLLRTVSVPHPETLVRIRYAGQNDMRTSSSSYGGGEKNAAGEDIRETTSYPIYQALRAANQTLTDIAASAPIGSLNVIVDGKADFASALIVSGN